MSAEPTARLEHLRLRDLLIIERVHELGSLRKVAESMHLTQPAVTQALQTLEDAFGAQLVHRSSGGAILTDTGLAVLQRLRPMRCEAMAALAVAHRPQQPVITLGLNQVTAMDVAPAAVTAFLQLHPEVRIDLKESNSPELWLLLANGRVDAIVCRLLAAEAYEPISEGIVYDVLGTERMAVVAAKGHPLVAKGLGKAQLGEQRWVLPPTHSRARHTLNEWFVQADIPVPVASVTSESIHMNIRLVAASTLLTVVPRSTVDELAGPFGLAVVPVDTAWEGFSYAFACRRSSELNPLMRALRAHFLRLDWPMRGGADGA